MSMNFVKKWSGIQPLFKHLRTFGCIAWEHISYYYRKKLIAKRHSCIVMNYFEESKRNILFDPIKQKNIIRINVVFDENTLGINLLNPTSCLLTSDPFEIMRETKSTKHFTRVSTK